MKKFQLIYERPSAVDRESLSVVAPNICGFVTETISFSARSHRAAEEWVEQFVNVGTVKVIDPAWLFKQYEPGEPLIKGPRWITVPKRRSLMLIEVVKTWQREGP